MKVLVIPDVHLKPFMFDKATELLNKGIADKAICLMDIADNFGQKDNVELYAHTYDRAISFAKDFPNSLWCYGNHDVSYLWSKKETGFSFSCVLVVCEKLRLLKETLPNPQQLAFIHRIDNVLFLHAGLCDVFVKAALNSVQEREEKRNERREDRVQERENKEFYYNHYKAKAKEINYDDDYKNTDFVLEIINSFGSQMMWKDLSPIWFRPQYNEVRLYRENDFLQVVGHTPMKKITKTRNLISCDVFSTYANGNPIGTEEFLLLDTESWKFQGIKN